MQPVCLVRRTEDLCFANAEQGPILVLLSREAPPMAVDGQCGVLLGSSPLVSMSSLRSMLGSCLESLGSCHCLKMC